MPEHEGPQPPEQDPKRREPAPSEAVEEFKLRLEALVEGAGDEYRTKDIEGLSVCFAAPDKRRYFDVAQVLGSWDTTPLGLVMEVDTMDVDSIDHDTGTYGLTRYLISFADGRWEIQKIPLISQVGHNPGMDPEVFGDYRAVGQTVVTEREVDQLQFQFMRVEPVETEDVPFY